MEVRSRTELLECCRDGFHPLQTVSGLEVGFQHTVKDALMEASHHLVRAVQPLEGLSLYINKSIRRISVLFLVVLQIRIFIATASFLPSFSQYSSWSRQ